MPALFARPVCCARNVEGVDAANVAGRGAKNVALKTAALARRKLRKNPAQSCGRIAFNKVVAFMPPTPCSFFVKHAQRFACLFWGVPLVFRDAHNGLLLPLAPKTASRCFSAHGDFIFRSG